MTRVLRVFRTFRFLILAGLLVGSLVLNVAILVGASVFSAASAAFTAVTGVRTVAAAHASEVAELADGLVEERKLTRELKAEVAETSGALARERTATRRLRGDVADLSGDLVSERAAVKKARKELAIASEELGVERALTRRIRSQSNNPASAMVTFRGRKAAVSEAVSETADLISTRSRKSATREIGSMAGESLPWIGTAVIVGVTAMEIRDLCETIRDMNALKRAFNPDLEPGSDEKTVCSMAVPSRDEVWAAAKASPALAWEMASDLAPSLQDVRDFDPSEIDWSTYQTSVASGLNSAYGATERAVGGAIDATKDNAVDIWEWVTGPGASTGED